MREKKPALVIAFETTSQALAAEALFTSSGLPGRMIPLPSCISAGCGLAWKAEPEQQEKHSLSNCIIGSRDFKM